MCAQKPEKVTGLDEIILTKKKFRFIFVFFAKLRASRVHTVTVG